MRASRRVPWANKSDLGELFDFLFSPTADSMSIQRGISRMSIYIASPSCPAWVHLLHTLINASIIPYPPRSAHEAQILRMTYSMAIIRFINGMVDPLQTGPYARPISHIAASLGIPLSLIALRHRATHEDLPPLSLLQPALHACISYIHTYSFIPTLSSPSTSYLDSTSMNGTGSGNINGFINQRCERLMKNWKKVMKLRLRDKDVGEENESGREIRRLKRELEGEEIEDVVAFLIGEGGLVPIAKRKRPSRSMTAPPSASRQLWMPLLTHLKFTTPNLPYIVSETILSHLIESSSDPMLPVPLYTKATLPREKFGGTRQDNSFRWGLAVWLIWLWDSAELHLGDWEKKDLGRRLMEALLGGDVILHRLCSALSTIDGEFRRVSRGIQRLLPSENGNEKITTSKDDQKDSESSDEDREEEEKELVGLETPSAAVDDVTPEGVLDVEQRLAKMEARLNELRKARGRHVDSAIRGVERQMEVEGGDWNAPEQGQGITIGGWTKLSSEQWRPCPIGIWGAA